MLVNYQHRSPFYANTFSWLPFLNLTVFHFNLQSKNAKEQIEIPAEFHPFISGPNGSTVAAITERTGAKINIPPHSTKKTTIIIIGEKEGVAKAKDEIMKLYSSVVSTCSLYILTFKSF